MGRLRQRADRTVREAARHREGRRPAPRPCGSTLARARAPPPAGSCTSASAPAISPFAALTSARVITVAASSPGDSLIGRMRTSRSAFCCRRSMNPPSRGGAPAAFSIAPLSCESSRDSAAGRGTPVAANGSSAPSSCASPTSGCAAASSRANGSPRSTAARSETATNARRPALSAPAVEAIRSWPPLSRLAPARSRARSVPRPRHWGPQVRPTRPCSSARPRAPHRRGSSPRASPQSSLRAGGRDRPAGELRLPAPRPGQRARHRLALHEVRRDQPWSGPARGSARPWPAGHRSRPGGRRPARPARSGPRARPAAAFQSRRHRRAASDRRAPRAAVNSRPRGSAFRVGQAAA